MLARSEGLRLDEANRSVSFGGRSAVAPELTFRLLRLLLSRTPEIVPFAEIEAEVWGAQVSRETLKQRAKLLRDALTGIGVRPDVLEAVRNEGYRLKAISTHRTPRAPQPLVAAVLALVAIATLPVLGTSRVNTAPLSLAVEGDASAGAIRRALIRDLSRFDAIQVIDGSSDASDLVVRVALEADARASLQLQDSQSGAVLLAEAYNLGPNGYDGAVSHFSAYVHERLQVLAARPALSAAQLALFGDAARLVRGGDEAALLLARDKLRVLTTQRPSFLLAQALLARTDADLTLLFRHPLALALAARTHAADLVAAHPDVPEFRYTLARAELACGDVAAALEQMRFAERGMPFLRRDVLALERRLAGTTT